MRERKDHLGEQEQELIKRTYDVRTETINVIERDLGFRYLLTGGLGSDRLTKNEETSLSENEETTDKENGPALKMAEPY